MLFHCLFVFVILFIFVHHTAQDVLIYLFGESAVHLSVEGLGSVTVQELGRIVREALHIPESAQDAFAFWLSSPLLGKTFLSNTLFTLINAVTDYLVQFQVVQRMANLIVNFLVEVNMCRISM